MNAGLLGVRYFFIDIANDGIALYQSDDIDLPQPQPQPQPKTLAQAPAMAQEYFEEWLPSARRFEKASKFLLDDGGPREAAFSFHQATESY